MPPRVPINRHLFAGELVIVPAHPGVLRRAEQVAAGRFHQHLRGQAAERPAAPAWVITAIKRIVPWVKIFSMVIVIVRSSKA